MSDGLCDICNKRPATTTLRVQRDGRTQVIQVCDVDYKRLRDQRGYSSPFRSLFSEDPFGDTDSFFDDFGGLSSRFGYPIPRHREAIDIYQYFSEHTKELIQQAGRTALEFGRDEVDTEHLLYALTEEQIRSITVLQLERVKQTARGQGIELVFDDSLISYLARVSFVPEFGARELRRKIQSEVETALAREMLKGDVKEGDKVTLSYDENTKQVVLRKAEQRIIEQRPAKSEAAIEHG